MAGSLFWLSDAAWAAVAPHLSKNQPGARRVDDRRVISGIVHMLKCGSPWQDCPSEYGPSGRVYNGGTGGAIAASGRAHSGGFD
jgi:transposase